MRTCLCLIMVCLAPGGLQARNAATASLPESCRNLLLDARLRGNAASFRKGVRGTPRDLVYDPGTGKFARPSEYHEYGVGFGQNLGVVPEKKPFWWMAEWPKPVRANFIALSGVYENQPQPGTAWKIELRRHGKWEVHARGVGGWYDRGRYLWGGPGTPPIAFDALRVSVFSRDHRTPLQSIHFRGERGISWVAAYWPPIDARLDLPRGPVRAGRPVVLQGIPLYGKIRTWRWNFGDGTTAAGRRPRHVFTKLGAYRIRLTFSDGKHRAFRSGLLTVMPAFHVRIRFRPLSPAVNQPVQFQARVAKNAGIEKYEWDFGDGQGASGELAQHAFRRPGVHRVTLRLSKGAYSGAVETLVLVRPEKRPGRIPLWIDTDIGGDIDDAVCLLMAARDPRIQIVGVSTVRGCIGAPDTAAWLCRQILTRSGLSHTPVLPGAAAAITGKGAWPTGVGSYGELAPPPKPLSPAGDPARLRAIAAAMRKVGAPFHLLTIGPLTNAAWLAIHCPDVAARWLTVTCMAGRLSREPECNVQLDPDAARIVCEKLRPRLVAMEAIGPEIPRKEAEAALDPADPASAFLLKCYERYRAHADWTGVPVERRPLTIFDPTALLSLLRPDAFEFRTVRLEVGKDGAFRIGQNGALVRYAFSSDRDVIERLILEHLRAAAPSRH